MKKFKLQCLACVLCVSISSAAIAEETSSSTKAEPINYSLIFEGVGAAQSVAPLSEHESRNTSGEWVNVAAMLLAGGVANSVNYASAVPSPYRTRSGWAIAFGTGVAGVAAAYMPLSTYAFWGAGVGLAGGYTASRVGDLRNVVVR